MTSPVICQDRNVSNCIITAIDVRFRLVRDILGIPLYHAYILATIMEDGPPRAFSAACSVMPPDFVKHAILDFFGVMLGSPFGYLRAVAIGNKFVKGAPDYPMFPFEPSLNISIPPDFPLPRIFENLAETSRKIEGLQLRFHPLGQNSNSFIYTLLLRSGLFPTKSHLPKPPVRAPGWGRDLLF